MKFSPLPILRLLNTSSRHKKGTRFFCSALVFSKLCGVAAKLLALGNAQMNLAFPSFFRIFAQKNKEKDLQRWRSLTLR